MSVWRPDSLTREASDHGPIDFANTESTGPPPINAEHLTPQKARILLLLALTRSRDDLEIRRIFRHY
jgi:L-asparaginase/Glu-tRNA(Gln) amidotransferase subunit D